MKYERDESEIKMTRNIRENVQNGKNRKIFDDDKMLKYGRWEYQHPQIDKILKFGKVPNKITKCEIRKREISSAKVE